MFRYSLVLTLLLGGGSSPLWAQFEGVLEETQHDFGVVPRGQQLVHYFRIVNKGDKPLHIYNVSVSCGCTQAHAVDNTIPPGKETAVWASMDSSRFYGYKQVTIYVRFDQPQYTELRTAVVATSREDFAYSSTGINFGKVPAGEAKTGAMNITFYRGNLQLLEPSAESSFVVPTLKEVRRTATETVYEVDAKLRPDTPPGLWFTDVWVKTNDPGISKLRVPLTVEVQQAATKPVTPPSTTPTNVTPSPDKSKPEKTKPAAKPATPTAPTTTPTSVEPTSIQGPTTDEPPMLDAGTITANPVPTARPVTPITTPAPEPQQAYPQQAYPQQTYPQQTYPQQAYPQQAFPEQAAPQVQPPVEQPRQSMLSYIFGWRR
jgi:hypothetical protein